MMKTVQILLSSYNGEKYISRQIDSILQQKDVEVHLLIRDDGSTDGTRAIIKEYEKKYPANVKVVLGENMGWKKSFFTLLQLAGAYDYYAFADQDDYWYEDKEISSIKVMEDDSAEGPKLVQVNMIYSDEALNPIYPIPSPRAVQIRLHDEIYADDFFLGCSMTWNSKAMELFQRYFPLGNFGHDHWCGVICYLFGKVYFSPAKKFCYIRHEGNASTVGNKFHGRLNRVKSLVVGDTDVYDNFGPDLLKGYSDLMKPHDLQICRDFVNYRHDYHAKLRLLLNKNLKRSNLFSTVLFKVCIFLGKM